MGKVNLQPTDGFILQGWMVTELHLSGGDLIAFALVHQFTQSKAGIYKGGTSYLSAWTGWADNTCRTHLARLVELGLIRKVSGRQNNSPFCHYVLADDFAQKHTSKIEVSHLNNCGLHTSKTAVSTPQKLRRENNIDNTIEDNTPHTPSRGRTVFVKPTVEEVAAYCAERHNNIDPEAFVDFYDSKGWKVGSAPMKDWKAAVRTWEKRHKDDEGATPAAKSFSIENFIAKK